MVYRRNGGPEVIEAEDVGTPVPGPGEVLVRLAVSGVNPTDWKFRQGTPPSQGWQIPDHDGAGVVTAVGTGVPGSRVGERVWTWEAAHARPWGTAAEYSVLTADHAVPLGDASLDLGAALGVPFLTAHRCLTVAETLPADLAPGTLTGRTVLVQGGAGAVGNAAIQLARWAGATVISTVSGPEKGALAEAAGSTHVVDYRAQDVVKEVRAIAPDGVDLVVEVNALANAASDVDLLARHGTVAMYAATGEESVTVPIRPMMMLDARWYFVLLYVTPAAAKAQAIADVGRAVAADALRVGDAAGLPLHHFPLAEAAAAHAAVEAGAVGKVLITID